MTTAVAPVMELVTDLGKGREVRLPLYYGGSAALFEECLAWVRARKAVCFDIETSGLDPLTEQIAALQFGWPVGKDPRVYVLCLRTLEAEGVDLEPLRAVLRDSRITKVGQNLKFEASYCLTRLGVALRGVYDTQVVELVCRAGLFGEDVQGGVEDDTDANGRFAYSLCSLEALTMRYLGVPLDKDQALRTSFHSTPPGALSERQLRYAANDVVYPYYVARHQHALMTDRRLEAICTLENELVPILAQMEVTGVGIDRMAWLALYQEALVKRREAEQKLDELFLVTLPQQELFGLDVARPLRQVASTAVRSVNRKPKFKPILYTSPKQVLAAIKTYCEQIKWPVEIVTDKARVVELKQKYGQAWLKEKRNRKLENVPLWCIPAHKYCILVSKNKDVLRLARLRKQLPNELVQWLIQFSIYEKRATAFGVKYLEDNYRPQTGRVHFRWNQAITSTGRLSTEPNVQNLPRDNRYRKCVIPRPGYKFVLADYSQVEPRLTAQVTSDAVYIAEFRTAKPDIYSAVAAAQNGGTRPDKSTPAGKLMRQNYKTQVLAFAYCQGPAKFHDTWTLSLEKEILAGTVEPPTYDRAATEREAFFRTHHAIAAYQKQCQDLADPERTTRSRVWDDMLQDYCTYIVAPCGRKRYFPSTARNTFTESTNCAIQGCSATITKAAMVAIQRYIDAHGIDAVIVLSIHDEIVVEVREDQADAFAPVMKQLMEEAGARYLTKVPCVAEFPEGTNGVVGFWLKE